MRIEAVYPGPRNPGDAALLPPLLQLEAERDVLTSLVERDGQAAAKDFTTPRRLADLVRCSRPVRLTRR
jgi:hypothetical protein